VHGQLDVLARLAQPVLQGKTKVAGLKLENTRPNPEYTPDCRFEKAYLKVEKAMDDVIALMAA
jgi:hypothetical protein